MKIFYQLCFAFLLLSVIPSCKKKEKIADEKESTKLNSFKIEAKNNAGFIENDLTCKIVDNQIDLSIPTGVNYSSLIATFAIEGSTVTIDGVVQHSGITTNDFSKPITYTITATNGTSVTYNVVIKSVEDEVLKFSSYSLLKSYNTELTENIDFALVNDTLMGTYGGYVKSFRPTFSTPAKEVSIGDVKQTASMSSVDLTQTLTYTLTSAIGRKKDIVVKLKYKNIPHIYITTTGNLPIISKDDYLTGNIEIVGDADYASFKATTKVKGRGNTTWAYAKKPYKIKLDKKASIFGMGEDKEYVLLANYLDPSLMTNAVAQKAGLLLNMPYNNHIVPVDLTVNGTYLGSYMLTEQVTVNTNRIGIVDGGVLLELDSYYDEDYKFKSTNYNLPVNIKYPELTDQSQVTAFQSDFQILENLIKAPSFPNNNYADYIDLNQLANYLLVTNLVCNTEIGHPKSTYVYKPKNGKYTLGPLWDYDYAFSYQTGPHFNSTTTSMFYINAVGSTFFSRFFLDPAFKTIYKQKWIDFKASKLPQLQSYVDAYSATIKNSYGYDYKIWKRGNGSLDSYTIAMKNWLQGRATYMDNYVASF